MANRLMKRCSTTKHQENANQNHNDILLTPVRMAIIIKKKKNPQITNLDKDVEKREPLYIFAVRVKSCSYCGKQHGGSSKN